MDQSPEKTEVSTKSRWTGIVLAAILIVLLVQGGVLIMGARHWVSVFQSGLENANANSSRIETELAQLREEQRAALAAATAAASAKRVPSMEEQSTQEAEWETQKQDLANKLSDRVNPILKKLNEGQNLTNEQLTAARAAIIHEIDEVAKEEQRQNAELQLMLTGEQKRNQDLVHMIAGEQQKAKTMQTMIKSQQEYTAEIQNKSVTTYEVAADSYRIANELRLLYIQETKRESSVLANTMETVKLPFKLVENMAKTNIVKSGDLNRKEEELRKTFEELARRMQQCAPKSELMQPPVQDTTAPAPAK